MKFHFLFLAVLVTCRSLFAAAGGADADGYSWKDSHEADGPDFQWIEIKSTGREVVTTGDNVSSNNAAPVGIGGPVQLAVPWIYRGEVFDKVVPTSNGYLSFAPGETGADATPDCPLPAVPSQTSDFREDARIYVYHADLEHGLGSKDDNPGVFYQYFSRSPHAHHPGGVHVFTWHQMKRKSNAALISFQVLLFDNGDILMQYLNGSPVAGGYTIGHQNHKGTIASRYACGGSREIASGRAVLFEPPTVFVTSALDFILPGETTLRSAYGLSEDYGNNFSDGTPRRDRFLRVKFVPSLDGATITLSSMHYPYTNAGPSLRWGGIAIIDAASLPNGITISGNGEDGIFLGSSGYFNTLRYFHGTNLTFKNAPRVFDMQLTNDFASQQGNFYVYRTLLLNQCKFNDIVATDINQRGCIASLEPSGWTALRDTVVEDCQMRNAIWGIDSGVFAPFKKLTLEDCVFRNNTVSVGTIAPTLVDFQNGGFMNPGTLHEFAIDGCEFSNNEHHVIECRLTGSPGSVIARSTFHDNRLTPLMLRGEGLLDTLTIEACTFSENQGGAIDLTALRTNVVNCTFAENAGTSFSAIRLAPDSEVNPTVLRIAHSTFNENAASTSDGAALLIEDGTCWVQNTILQNSSSFSRSGSPNFRVMNGAVLNVGAAGVMVFPDDPAWGPAEGVLSPGVSILGTLGDHGGPTETYSLYSGSPAIDAGTAVAPVVPLPETDQRGFPRVQDSDGNGTARLNIGAVELGLPVIVTTAADETSNPATLSFREAVAALPAGGRITFAPSLSGATLNLNSELAMNQDYEIDAGNLGSRIIIKRAGTALRMTQPKLLTLRNLSIEGSSPGILLDNAASLTLQSCRIANCFSAASGAGIRSYGGGTVTITDSILLLNEASGNGGAIYYQGPGHLTLQRSTVVGNTSALNGGGIYTGVDTNLLVERSSVVRNRSMQTGGGIYGDGSLSLLRSTVGDNTAVVGIGSFRWTGILGCSFSTIHRNAGSSAGHFARPGEYYDHSIIAANRHAANGVYNGDFTGTTGDYNLIDVAEPAPPPGANSRHGRPLRLTPLGWHGGPVPTYMPLCHSPAIDAGAPTAGTFMQDGRGFWFRRDGNGDGITRADIGAVEASEPVVVTTSANQLNTPAGAQVSLREAVRDCPPGGRITFAPALSGGTCTLGTSGELSITGKAIILDATSLPRGVIVSQTGTSRLFNVTSTGSLSMHAVSLSRGDTAASGAALLNSGRTLLTRLALFDNESAATGGAISHQGAELALEHCTLANNFSFNGGSAIAANGPGPVLLHHCTVVGNSTALGAAMNFPDSTYLEMSHSAFAENRSSGGTGVNFYFDGAFLSRGWNASDVAEPYFTATGDLQNVALNLGGFTDGGGYSRTAAPNAGSPLINAGSPSFFTIVPGEDQRGARRPFGPIDIGARESGRVIDADGDGMYDWWELVYGFNPDLPNSGTFDTDGDGSADLAEFLAGTHPRDFTGPGPDLRIISMSINEPGQALSDITMYFTSGAGIGYDVEWSEDLDEWYLWTPVYGQQGTTTTGVSLLHGYDASAPRRFFRIKTSN